MPDTNRQIIVKHTAKGWEALIKVPLSVMQKTVLAAWLAGWTLTGLSAFIALIFGCVATSHRPVVWMYLAFWAYFEYLSVYIWLWHSYGKEMLRYGGGILEIKNDIMGYGVVKQYFVENIRNPSYNEIKQGSLSSFLNQGFWVVGDEKVQFEFHGQKVLVGRRMDAKYSSVLLGLLRGIKKQKGLY